MQYGNTPVCGSVISTIHAPPSPPPSPPSPPMLSKCSVHTKRTVSLTGRDRSEAGKRKAHMHNITQRKGWPFSPTHRSRLPLFCFVFFNFRVCPFYIGLTPQGGGHLREPRHVPRGGPDRHRARVGPKAVRRRQGAGQPAERHGGPTQGRLVPLHEQGAAIRGGHGAAASDRATRPLLQSHRISLAGVLDRATAVAHCVFRSSACASCWSVRWCWCLGIC